MACKARLVPNRLSGGVGSSGHLEQGEGTRPDSGLRTPLISLSLFLRIRSEVREVTQKCLLELENEVRCFLAGSK